MEYSWKSDWKENSWSFVLLNVDCLTDCNTNSIERSPQWQGVAKVGLQLWICTTDFIFVLLFINYCISFHMNNCKPTFAPPCVIYWLNNLENNMHITTLLGLQKKNDRGLLFLNASTFSTDSFPSNGMIVWLQLSFPCYFMPLARVINQQTEPIRDTPWYFSSQKDNALSSLVTKWWGYSWELLVATSPDSRSAQCEELSQHVERHWGER